VIALEELNGLPAADFVRTLGGIFEHSPWVPERVAAARPFASRERLLAALRAAVDAATPAEQLALIRAHPTLGLRGRARATLTPASAREQSGAGLELCTDVEALRLEALNAAYAEKFSMPFVVAVRGHTPESIIAECERRLHNDADAERRTALGEIGSIAGFRLNDLVAQRGE
jgi:2-oxo-4-hydroxy-4-carboxy-5-ureidoimidazoline decarboxylase